MENVIKWYDHEPNQRGGQVKQGARQIMVSHTQRGDRNNGYWRVVLGTAISAEILEWAGENCANTTETLTYKIIPF